MTAEKVPSKTIRATAEQIAEFRRYLEEELEYNAARGLELFDIEDELQREITEFEHAIYMDILRPLIEEMFERHPGFPGIAGRILGHIELYGAAMDALRERQGIVPLHPIRFDLIKFLTLYEQGELDRWGGAFVVVHDTSPSSDQAA